MGRRTDNSLLGVTADLIAELPEPLRSITAFGVAATFILTGFHVAIPFFKRSGNPLPWPLNWMDAIETFNWASLGSSL